MVKTPIVNQKQGNVTITENGSGPNASSMEQVLRSLVAKLQAHNEEVMENEANYKALESPIQGPDRSRLTLFVESNHCALLVELFRAVLEAQKCGTGEGSDSDSLINCLSKAFKLFCQMTELVIKSPSNLLINREEHFEKLVSIIEVIIYILPIKVMYFLNFILKKFISVQDIHTSINIVT